MNEDLQGSTADADQVRESRGREKRISDQDVADFKAVMDTKQGRRFVAGLIDAAGVWKNSMTGNSWTFFNEGYRNMGLRLMDMVNTHTPDLYPVMMRDYNEVRRKPGG